jgi:Protein of unknown function (DUF2934)
MDNLFVRQSPWRTFLMAETVNTPQRKARSTKAKSAEAPKTNKLNGTQMNGAAEAKGAAKPRKTAAKKNNVVEIAAPAATPREPAAASRIPAAISHEQVALLAHRFWYERGCEHGHHEEDWRRAEQELRGKAS